MKKSSKKSSVFSPQDYSYKLGMDMKQGKQVGFLTEHSEKCTKFFEWEVWHMVQ